MPNDENIFSGWVKEYEALQERITEELTKENQTLKQQGKSTEEIEAIIEKHFNDKMNEWEKKIKPKDSGNMVQVPTLYKWVMDSSFNDHCEDCIRNANSGARTFEEWDELGLPGTDKTKCNMWCRCALKAD